MKISDQEKLTILSFNDTDKVYVNGNENNLINFFEKQAINTPNNIAVLTEKNSFTYYELNAISNQFAFFLKAKFDIKLNDIVVVNLNRSEYLIAALYAVIKAGATFVPVEINLPKNRLDYIIGDTKCKCVINEQLLNKFLLEKEKFSKDNLEKINTSSDLAYIIYTSGTTGKPKGVMIEHKAIINRLLWMQDSYALTDSDTLIQKTSISFDVSVWELFWWGMFGARLFIPDMNSEKDPLKLIKYINEFKITVIHFVPSMFSFFLDNIRKKINHIDLSNSLKVVYTSGESLKVEQSNTFFNLVKNVSLINLYGPTEAAIDVTYFDCVENINTPRIPIGRPISNVKMFVLDENLEFLPIGKEGMLYISGVCLSRGYLNNIELTSEKFIESPYNTILYKTGDIAKWLPDGNIEFLGRDDFQVKIRGNRVELEEIESQILKSSPEIINALVILKEIDNENVLVAFYYTEDEKTIDLEKIIRDHLKSQLPEYMHPTYYAKLDNFPINNNGKADRAYISQLPVKNKVIERSSIIISSRNEMDRLMIDLWKEILELETIGINENFFDLGGTSLKTIELASIINESELFEDEVSPITIFENNTIEKLNDFLSSQKKDNTEDVDDEAGKIDEILNILNL
ncbi:amino acid adenylation domain-containing protein [Chryseobacterium nematophagum]|uniref:Amino acid adenylation domain-containing protein n=1 Tax=Chryseobacterium nematophagum TaxID=2305228 RepID=A0A3M7L7P4_9FLAO|nr:non-ribosomal peptide synthetase [Chryseobacterium nematophagum]RMZ58778.1 amino acid adenylation domain-containing protein [Chryseobacterium nematophagum]